MVQLRAEDEYVKKMEYEKIQKAFDEEHKSLKKKQKEELKALHHMRCPKCGMELIEIDYKSIKIDKCSECDGVWLDAGELEAVLKLEKSVMNNFFGVFKRTP